MFDHYRSMSAVCEVEGCEEVVVGEDAWCGWCRTVRCRAHYDDAEHYCRYTGLERNPKKSLFDCLKSLDAKAIQSRAEALRPGHTCVIDIPLDGTALAGAYNVHVGIKFDDGKEWLMRTPYCDGPMPPVDVLCRVYRSEALTLVVLERHGIPVPAVYDCGAGPLTKGQEGDGTVYTFFEKVAGRPSDNTAPPEIKQKYIESYARQAIAVSQIPFDCIGSLDMDSRGRIVTGNVVNTRVGLAPIAPYFDGPFKTITEMYLHNVEGILKAIRDGTIYRDRPLFEYLAHSEVKMWLLEDKSMDMDQDEFYLWHPDSHSDNMMVGPDHQISSMIDWQGAMTMPKSVTFGGPEWMWGAGPLWDPTNSLSDDERHLCDTYIELGREDLAECVVNGRIHQRLNCFIGGGIGWYKESRLDQLRCVESLLSNDPVEHEEDETQALWVSRALHRHWHDPDLMRVFRLENLKEQGRQPLLPLPYYTGAVLQTLVSGVRFIRHGLQGAIGAVRSIW